MPRWHTSWDGLQTRIVGPKMSETDLDEGKRATKQCRGSPDSPVPEVLQRTRDGEREISDTG